MVSHLDKSVGKILTELKRLDLDKNTLVIFTSDNGPHNERDADPDFLTVMLNLAAVTPINRLYVKETGN